ncbi:MAG TPA: hypothetical protein VF984_12590, partial [Actinomycetota bacterium]
MDRDRSSVSSSPPRVEALPPLVSRGLAGPLLGQMPAVVWVVDPELRFTVSEGGGLVALGAEPGENVGRSLFEFFGT